MTETKSQLKRYQAIIQNVRDGIHVMDSQGDIVEVNDAFCDMLGYTRGEAGKLNIAAWNSQYSKEELRVRLQGFVGKSARFETVHCRKDGTPINVEVNTAGVDIEGQTYFFASSRDITERKKQQAALEISESYQRAIFNATPDATVVSNTQGVITMANAEVERTLGYKAEELIGQSIEILLPELLRASHPALRTQFAASPKVRPMGTGRLVRALRKDGSEIDVEISLSPIQTAQGLFFASSLRDITERKELEQSLKLAQHSLDLSQDAIFRIDRDARITYVNEAACQHLGYSRDELLALSIPDIDPGFPMEVWDKYWDEMESTGQNRFETRHKLKDGTIVPVEITTKLFEFEGAQINLASARNISERKQIEAELFAAKQAEEASQIRSKFLTSMSHELRTPLNAILGFGQLLDMDANFSTSEQRESVSHILTAGHQLLALINDLLDFSQIDIGKLRLNIQPLRIADIASSCGAQVAAAMASQKNIVIENTLADPALIVLGDNQRVRQVLINLLSNAVKYNQDNGRVTVSGKIEQEGRLRIKVRDTGLGIPDDKLSLLFTPFERIDQSHGTISGVGIGLHITKQLVEAMHGTVGVESVLGQGSTFCFDLPLAEQVSESDMTPEKDAKPMLHEDARLVVLYIEDNPVNLKLVQAALKNRPGIELLTAVTAEEGMTIAEEQRPDLILMDIQLPGIDGITATTVLKEMDATRDIPVVALSADAHKKEIDRALNAGCSAYLTKPVQLQALYELIDRVRLENKNV